MLENITYYPIFDIPFIVYLGIITILLFFLTALIAFLRRKGKIKISIKWHYYLAYISITLGLIHGILVLLAYF
ncbi:MAG: hypothetical protein KAJ21_01530 [Thermoplasmatales archaeon]|nr:hypothetical protein [Thermoplasmatales archaeon]